MATMNPNTNSDDHHLSPTTVGAIAGGVTAATVLSVLVIVPSTMWAFQMPDMAGWLVVIFFYTLFWAFVAAISGAVAGGFAARTGKLLKGILIGLVTAVPCAIAYEILFIWPEDGIFGTLFLLLFGAVVGGSSGLAGALAGRRARQR
jgi:hypothetical protein